MTFRFAQSNSIKFFLAAALPVLVFFLILWYRPLLPPLAHPRFQFGTNYLIARFPLIKRSYRRCPKNCNWLGVLKNRWSASDFWDFVIRKRNAHLGAEFGGCPVWMPLGADLAEGNLRAKVTSFPRTAFQPGCEPWDAFTHQIHFAACTAAARFAHRSAHLFHTVCGNQPHDPRQINTQRPHLQTQKNKFGNKSLLTIAHISNTILII